MFYMFTLEINCLYLLLQTVFTCSYQIDEECNLCVLWSFLPELFNGLCILHGVIHVQTDFFILIDQLVLRLVKGPGGSKDIYNCHFYLKNVFIKCMIGDLNEWKINLVRFILLLVWAFVIGYVSLVEFHISNYPYCKQNMSDERLSARFFDTYE